MVASGVNARIAYKGETTQGLTVAGNFAVQRCINRNINLKKATLESQESSSSRLRKDVRHGFKTVEGEIQVELALEAYNDWLLWSVGTTAWFTPATVVQPGTTNLSVTNTDTFTRSSGSWITDNYRVGDWVRTTNFTTSANNGDWRVRSVTNLNLQVWNMSGTNEAGVSTSTVAFIGKKAVVGANSQLLKTFSLERELLDLDSIGTDLYQIFRGCSINQLAVAARPEGLATATFRILGGIGTQAIDGTAPAQGGGSPAGYDAAATNSPLASIDGTVYTGSFTLDNATAFDCTIDNQRSLTPTIGRTTSVGVFEGVSKVTGSLSVLLQNATRVAAFQSEAVETTGWQLRLNELGTTDFLTFNFYRVKLTTAEIDPPQNGPVVQQVNWEALANTITDGTSTFIETMHIQRSTTT